MKKPNLIELPNLNDYKQDFIQQGVKIPLPTVPFSKTGLLAELPPPPSGKTGWPWTVETQPPTATMPNGLPKPKISIVMPSYNQGEFIEETIRSVLLQNYPNLEYIVCDGGSTDNTKEILEKYSSWLSFWHSKKDRGQGHAINLGFSIASGDYFGWINSDDFYLPNCLLSIATHFSMHIADFVYGDAINIDDNKRQIQYWQGYLVLDRYLRFGGLISSHSAFWKNAIHVPICESINCAIDYELWIRLLHKKIKKHIRTPLAVFRVQTQSKSSHERFQAFWQEDHEKIISTYGLPPHACSLISYEFRIIQKIYKQITKKTDFIEEVMSLLQRYS